MARARIFTPILTFPRRVGRKFAVLSYAALGLLSCGAAGLFAAAGAGWDASLTRAVAAGSALCVVGGVGAAWYALIKARRDAESIDLVAESARRIADGELGHRAVLTSSSSQHSGQRPGQHSGQDLAEAFNAMSGAIADRVRRLETERYQLATAIDTMADGVVVIDSHARVTLINRAAEWMLEVNAQTALGRPLAQALRDHEALRLASSAAQSGQMRAADIELLYQRRFLNVIATPMSEHGREDVLLTLRDITSLRQLETTRREFVSNVSHELRSPLASANAMVEVLEAGAMDDRDLARDFLDRISDDIARMTALVDELLELSRLESGQMPIHLSPVSVGDVIAGTVERFSFAAASTGVQLAQSVPPDMPYVMAEEGKLSQILTNLVENALRFTPDGGRITLSAERDAQWVTVSVADTGIGIPREHLSHIFERFYKVDRSRRDGGTGLGLAIVKHLVQAHGGEVSATSVEGEGSEFVLKLRRAT